MAELGVHLFTGQTSFPAPGSASREKAEMYKLVMRAREFPRLRAPCLAKTGNDIDAFHYIVNRRGNVAIESPRASSNSRRPRAFSFIIAIRRVGRIMKLKQIHARK